MPINKNDKKFWTASSTLFVTPLDVLSRFSLYAGGCSLFLMLAVYLYEVVARYFFNAPTAWSNDVIQLFFATTIMLSLPEITRRKVHITISFFLEKMIEPSLLRHERVMAFVGSVICLVACWICSQESIRQYSLGIETLWNYPIPKWWVSAFIPYGLLLTGLQLLRASLFREDIREK